MAATSRTRQLGAELGAALRAAGFTHTAVGDLLGPVAAAALRRDETTPALRATRGGSALETLVRLWPLQTTVALSTAEQALPGLVDRLCVAGILEQTVGEVRARVDVSPYATDTVDLWLASDLTPGLDGSPHRMTSDYVLGVSGASISLAQITSRDPVGTALDVGTGSGLQSLHLSAHSERVVATDVNARALWLTDLNLGLNGVDNVETREGSWFAPVAGERFDLVVSNPPFVISPATGEQLVYRDSGLPGDRAVEQMVRGVPRHLAPGGRCHLLGDWVVRRGQPWEERLAEMVGGTGCHAWVVQREQMDPAAYVELWLKDAGHHGGPDYAERYDTWLSWFEDQGVEAIGFGWINLELADEEPRVRVEDWPWEVEQPIAQAFGDWTGAQQHLRRSDDDLLGSRPVRRPDVLQETHGRPGAADPERIVVRQQRLVRRARQVDTVEAALVGALDGELTVGATLDAVASLLGEDPAATRARALPVVRELLDEGYLELS